MSKLAIFTFNKRNTPIYRKEKNLGDCETFVPMA